MNVFKTLFHLVSFRHILQVIIIFQPSYDLIILYTRKHPNCFNIRPCGVPKQSECVLSRSHTRFFFLKTHSRTFLQGVASFFLQNEFFGKNATKDLLFGGTIRLPVLFQEVLKHWNFLLNINLER